MPVCEVHDIRDNLLETTSTHGAMMALHFLTGGS